MEIKVTLVNFEEPNRAMAQELLSVFINRTVLQLKKAEEQVEIEFDNDDDSSIQATYLKISGLTKEQQNTCRSITRFPSFTRVEFVD